MEQQAASREQRYAELLIRVGVNLQPGQSLIVRAELAHAAFVRLVAAAAYQAGAGYVHVDWEDDLLSRAMLLNANIDELEVPAYEMERFRQLAAEGWARLALVGPEFPHAYADVPAEATRTWAVKRMRARQEYRTAMMANRIQWCVAAVPTPAWALRIFPDLLPEEALARLWDTVLHLARADSPDPIAAWHEQSRRLKSVARYLHERGVRTVHLFDPTPGPDGKPATDLTIGLTDRSVWLGGGSQTPAGVVFQANMPTEEVFTTPHNGRADGYVRTSRPSFPLQREVRDAWFRFAGGQVVDFSAAAGQDALEQFLAIEGARRLGELALVDSASPVFASGLTFYEILFDENAAVHIAFGEAYAEGIEGGADLSREDLAALGANFADTHVDFMVGTPTMHVTGLTADGQEVPIMVGGRFVPAVVAGG